MVTGDNNLSRLAAGRRIVIKIGSSLLVNEAKGTLHRAWLDSLVADIAALKSAGQDVVIVSSGAIAVGRRHLGLADGELRLDEKQAAAATGMIRLAHAYQESLAGHQITVSQVLLSLDDSENRRRYINARNTIEALLRLKSVPLINENDTVATDEIRLGDNDRLAARVAAMISADIMVLLSDIDGLYSADPHSDPNAEMIAEVGEITPEIEAMAGHARPGDGTGGMTTKLAAARIVLDAGCSMVIADGKCTHPLENIKNGAACTWFVSSASPRSARKRWISGSLKSSGVIIVDGGALNALEGGKSLLPVGVVEVDGEFNRGDAVVVKTIDGNEIGRGLSAYSSKDARLIMGHKSGEIEVILGYRGRDEMIHRDDLVLI